MHQQDPDAPTVEDPIFMIDEVELRPGRLDSFLDALERDYRPGAEARGLRLVQTLVTPPTRTAELPATVLLFWQLDGVVGFWTMRSQNATEEVARFWKSVESDVSRRTRRYAAAPESAARFDAAGQANA